MSNDTVGNTISRAAHDSVLQAKLARRCKEITRISADDDSKQVVFAQVSPFIRQSLENNSLYTIALADEESKTPRLYEFHEFDNMPGSYIGVLCSMFVYGYVGFNHNLFRASGYSEVKYTQTYFVRADGKDKLTGFMRGTFNRNSGEFTSSPTNIESLWPNYEALLGKAIRDCFTRFEDNLPMRDDRVNNVLYKAYRSQERARKQQKSTLESA